MNDFYSPQEKIEKFMSEVIKLGNYETAYLLSEEGLALAHELADEIVPEERLVELMVIFQQVQKMADVMGGISEIKELVIEGHNKRKIIFRFFDAFDQKVILALIIPPQKTYRGFTNRLVQLIQKVSD